MIKVENLSVKQGVFALHGVSFEVPEGKYAVLMGKTGCGKTTILEAICGLRAVAGGRITLMKTDVTALKPANRGIGYVPQDAALFLTMTVRDNLAFALTLRKWDKKAINNRVGELADLLGIEHLLDRMPAGLSGGESQRVALGRALAGHPGVLCMDEPLSALDESTREELYMLLESVKARAGVTTLHITHNHSEARRLADRIILLEDGCMQDVTLRLAKHDAGNIDALQSSTTSRSG